MTEMAGTLQKHLHTAPAPLTGELPGIAGHHSDYRHNRISARLISGERHRGKPAYAPSIAARPFPSPSAEDAPMAATVARRRQIRGKFRKGPYAKRLITGRRRAYLNYISENPNRLFRFRIEEHSR